MSTCLLGNLSTTSCHLVLNPNGHTTRLPLHMDCSLHLQPNGQQWPYSPPPLPLINKEDMCSCQHQHFVGEQALILLSSTWWLMSFWWPSRQATAPMTDSSIRALGGTFLLKDCLLSIMVFHSCPLCCENLFCTAAAFTPLSGSVASSAGARGGGMWLCRLLCTMCVDRDAELMLVMGFQMEVKGEFVWVKNLLVWGGAGLW